MRLFAGATNSNLQTSAATRKEVEVELRKWFGNARDRGEGSRKKLKMISTASSDTPNSTTEGHGNEPATLRSDSVQLPDDDSL